MGTHLVCAVVTAECLEHQASIGNDLSTPMPLYRFPGLVPGDRWCVTAANWLRAHEDGMAAYVVLAATPPSDDLERALAAAAPRSLFDRRDELLRALLRVPPSGEMRVVEAVRAAHEALPSPVAVGLSSGCRGVAAFAAGFEEARHALLGTTVAGRSASVMTYEELGPYKYLLRMSLETGVRDASRDAVARLAEYDSERSTSLLRTLEEFLRRRGNISATADALYVHPNTLRQRLRRIAELTGVDLRRDDWLIIEIAVKLVRLQQALAPTQDDTSGRPGV